MEVNNQRVARDKIHRGEMAKGKNKNEKRQDQKNKKLLSAGDQIRQSRSSVLGCHSYHTI